MEEGTGTAAAAAAEVEEEVAVTPSPSKAKRPRRSVQSKLSWAVPKAGGANGVEAVKVEAAREEIVGCEEEKREKREKRKRRGIGTGKPEAGIATKETFDLSPRKKMHPFFACWGSSNRILESQNPMKVEGSQLLRLDGKDFVSCPPIHVCDKSKCYISLDWNNWVFKDESPLESAFVVSNAAVNSLTLVSTCHKELQLDQLSDSGKRGLRLHGGNDLTARCDGCMGSLGNEHHDNTPSDSYWPECSLWTNKYQPEDASQVCGNSESIRFLSEWLKAWYERGRRKSNNCKYDEHIVDEDVEDNLYECGSESDDINEADLTNVLLITGPVGSGKSAAVYACAKEQGFQVIEVNTSDLRNGAHVRQKFGEAVGSLGLNRWSCDNIHFARRKNLFESISSACDSREDSENCSREVVVNRCSPDKASSECTWGVRENNTAPKCGTNKTLILFEDVDTVFDEDRGFISTVVQLADTTKWPIVLTSNNKNPILPQLLGRLSLEFKHPSFEELLSLVELICTSERAKVSSSLMKHLIKSCLGDIRKTIMLLQFWSQGRRDFVDKKIKCTCSPLPFDIDAAHSVMPRILPWEFPCELAGKLYEEINLTIDMLEDYLQGVEAPINAKLNFEEMKDFFSMGKNACKSKKTMKKPKLKAHHTVDCSEVPAHENDLDDFSDASDSPVPNVQGRVTSNRFMVLSSQSDDDLYDEHLPEDNKLCNYLLHDTSVATNLHGQEASSLLELPADLSYQFRKDNYVQTLFEGNRTISTSCVYDSFKMQDVSFVPESSVSGAETIKNDEFLSTAVSPDNLNGLMFKSNEYLETLVGVAREADVESVVQENLELWNSQNEDEATTVGYHLMDECSRPETMWLVSGSSKCSPKIISVQDTWNKLRGQRDLRSHLNHHKAASEAVNLASGITGLISETDIMFTSCKPLVNDVLEPSLTRGEEPDSFSWPRFEYKFN
ncbi:uncharacterized protein LOC109721170 isoform X3 [Ananas comosus]|uniref:Uncharacterized protein LOC109721170 isoform X3 n=1 Tax=Ananas comosus TaxID=4615 RepID=A0A6P5GE65_ANACO|nr:uncharacterized protein LOC109721170 isoform X3 [Ananas comosus]